MKLTFRITLTLILLAFSIYSFSQEEGDALFGYDQVAKFELTFHQTDYWDSLEANYLTETYMPADLKITDSIGNVTVFFDVGVRFKGNSTYNHPNNKKPFKIDFNKYDDNQNYDGLKKLNFSNGFKDPSCMREKVFFDFCREAGVNAPRANFANVYFNDELIGFYTVVEQIDDQFLDWAVEEDDGNLFKAGDNFGGGPGGAGEAADLIYYGTTSTDYGERYELKTNEDINDWSDLISFINFINNSSDSEFELYLYQKMEVLDYLRSLAIDNLFSNLDSYTGSARNYYLYHNMDTDKWEWIKWDANEAFGSYTNNAVTMTTLAIDYHNSDRPLIERIFNSDDLYFQYQLQMCDLLENYFNNGYLDTKIDSIKTLIQDDVYADVNKMYSDSDFDNNINSNITSGGGPGGGTIYGLKSFVTSRNNYVSGQLDCTTLGVSEIQEDNKVSIYPNPASNNVNIEFIGDSPKEIRLINTNGQVVNNANVLNNNSSIDVSELANGIYILQIDYLTELVTKKIVIKR